MFKRAIGPLISEDGLVGDVGTPHIPHTPRAGRRNERLKVKEVGPSPMFLQVTCIMYFAVLSDLREPHFYITDTYRNHLTLVNT